MMLFTPRGTEPAATSTLGFRGRATMLHEMSLARRSKPIGDLLIWHSRLLRVSVAWEPLPWCVGW